MAAYKYEKLQTDPEKAHLLAEEATNVNFIPLCKDERHSSKGRRCLRFCAVFLMLVSSFYAIRLINLSCRSTVVAIIDSSLYQVGTFSEFSSNSDSFEVDPADVDSILLDVKGDIVSKINTRITSQSNNILFAYKTINQNPDVKANVTVKHSVVDGILRVIVDSPACKPGDGKDHDKPGHKKPGHKKPGDGDKKPGDGDKKPGDGDKNPGDGDKKPGDGDKNPSDGGKKPGHKKPDDKPKDGCSYFDNVPEYVEERPRRHPDHCKDIIIEMTMYLPQSRIKENTNLKVNAVKSTFTSEDMTNIQLGAFDIHLNSGVIYSRGVKAKTFFLYVESGGINGIYKEYTSFLAKIEHGGINLEYLKSNQNHASNVHLVAKTGGILVSKIDFSQNYVNIVDALVKNGGVKIFARDSFSGDFTVQTEVGAYKVSADTSGLQIENNISSPTGGFVSGTFRSQDILQNGRIKVQAGHGSSELKFSSNN